MKSDFWSCSQTSKFLFFNYCGSASPPNLLKRWIVIYIDCLCFIMIENEMNKFFFLRKNDNIYVEF